MQCAVPFFDNDTARCTPDAKAKRKPGREVSTRTVVCKQDHSRGQLTCEAFAATDPGIAVVAGNIETAGNINRISATLNQGLRDCIVRTQCHRNYRPALGEQASQSK